jgi:predicted secreted protein
MSWPIGIAAYVVIWWIVIFAVLPWGVQRNEAPEPGHDAGAPVNPRLKMKALVTTVVAGVLWGILYLAVEKGIMDFRGPT